MTSFPFSAIVGQDDFKRALLCNAVDPRIGGVLAIGERGTAKSTLARALAGLLPAGNDSDDLAGTVVELPLGSTLDRVVGSFDIATALGGGEYGFSPGLLARADGGFLYVDEVNLLADHITDVLLDVAESGKNYVERDGISTSHSARFALIGTMNPEEGELRPQFLDRFGLSVTVTASRQPTDRALVVRRRLAFERDPQQFLLDYGAADAKLAQRVVLARRLFGGISLADCQLERIAQICAQLGVEGMRADIVTARTAVALAALDGMSQVEAVHISDALMLALPHRMGAADCDRHSEQKTAVAALWGAGDQAVVPLTSTTRARSSQLAGAEQRKSTVLNVDSAGESELVGPKARGAHGLLGRHERAQLVDGAVIGSAALASDQQLHVPSSLQALAKRRSQAPASARQIEVSDLRSAVQAGRDARLIVLAIDVSGSVFSDLKRAGIEQSLSALITDGARKRDRLAVIVFGGDGARLLSPPTRNHAAILGLLRSVEPGGTTPLAAGLQLVDQLVVREQRRDAQCRISVVLLTDGRANVALAQGDALAEAHALARQLRKRATDNYVVADIDWHAERLAQYAAATLVRPAGLLRVASSPSAVRADADSSAVPAAVAS